MAEVKKGNTLTNDIYAANMLESSIDNTLDESKNRNNAAYNNKKATQNQKDVAEDYKKIEKNKKGILKRFSDALDKNPKLKGVLIGLGISSLLLAFASGVIPEKAKADPLTNNGTPDSSYVVGQDDKIIEEEEVEEQAQEQKSGGGESQQKKHEKVVKEIDESGKNMEATYGGKSAKDVNTKDVYKKGESNTTTGSTQNDASSAKSAQEQKEEATKKAEEKANKSGSQVIEGNKGVVIQGEQPAPKTPTPSQDAPTTKSDVQEQQQQQQEAPKKKLGDAIKQREQNQQNNDQQARNQIEMEIE